MAIVCLCAIPTLPNMYLVQDICEAGYLRVMHRAALQLLAGHGMPGQASVNLQSASTLKTNVQMLSCTLMDSQGRQSAGLAESAQGENRFLWCRQSMKPYCSQSCTTWLWQERMFPERLHCCRLQSLQNVTPRYANTMAAQSNQLCTATVHTTELWRAPLVVRPPESAVCLLIGTNA